LDKTLFSNPADDLRIISTRTSIDFALARACARTRAGGEEKLTKFRPASCSNNVSRQPEGNALVPDFIADYNAGCG
jgi:hypothetical protein